MKPLKVGILGCGAIAPAYLRNLKNHFGSVVDVVACADTVMDAAKNRAAEFGVPRVYSPEDLLSDPEIELVVNLTPARAHFAVSRKVLDAGKHLFSEKPLALTRADGQALLKIAAQRRLQLGGAADTFLGAGLQCCRRLIDEGGIGTPIAAQALIAVPFFHDVRYHEVFRGPLLDLGPYYLTALVALLGPISRVAAAADIRFPTKTHSSDGPNMGKMFVVDIPSTVSAVFDFASGPVASLIASCDLHGYFPRVEIYGTKGSLLLNDANHYVGKITLTNREGTRDLELPPGFCEKGRGLGVAEMAMALREGRSPRASGSLMYHILDAMIAVHDSSAENRHIRLESRVDRPELFNYVTLAPPSA